MIKIDKFSEFGKELHVFDFDDTLVHTPSFEDIAVKYLKENLTVKDLLFKSINLINVELKDLK